MTTHEQELYKHVHNFNTVEKTFNQWQVDVATTQQQDQQAVNAKIAKLEAQITA
jgi:hypothetical protein